MQDRSASSGESGLSDSGKRVLIVEDEPIVAFALEDMLEEMGHSPVGIVTDMEQALPILERGGADVVILDVNLHGTKSYPLADWLQDRGIAYMFASGYGDSEHPERHSKVATLSKPYSQLQLREALDQLPG